MKKSKTKISHAIEFLEKQIFLHPFLLAAECLVFVLI